MKEYSVCMGINGYIYFRIKADNKDEAIDEAYDRVKRLELGGRLDPLLEIESCVTECAQIKEEAIN